MDALFKTNRSFGPFIIGVADTDENSWSSITRRNNLLSLAESCKGHIDDKTMCGIISTSVEDGGSRQNITRYQFVYTPGTMKLLIRIERDAAWTEVNLKDFFDRER